MTLPVFLEKVVKEFRRRKLEFAIVGGLVASIYRHSARATHDLDFLLFTENAAQKTAEDILKVFNMQGHPLRKADLEGGPMFAIKKKNTPVYIVAGRSKRKGFEAFGLDILLPEIPWAAEAIGRAQLNQIDFGFGPLPCITIEDFLISKFYAISNQSTRFMDMDDIKSIFESHSEIDLSYLGGQMKKLNLSVPKALHGFTPKILLNLTKN